VKAVIFTGDQRPDRSRRNGIIDPDSSADINILGLQTHAQSLEAGLAFTGNHDLKSVNAGRFCRSCQRPVHASASSSRMRSKSSSILGNARFWF
jgi:hypothetical protein